MESEGHWDRVYRARPADQVSWYRPHLETSLALIEEAVPDRGARIIDVGGGESTLVDDLLAHGYRDIEVLDLSTTALDHARARLGRAGDCVRWTCADVTTHEFHGPPFDAWHDRAVFHFLTDPADRAAYVRQVERAVRPGGCVIVAVFGPQGPMKCSGLDTVRYDSAGLHAQFGAGFRLLRHGIELHYTPRGDTQQFVYCLCRLGGVEPLASATTIPIP